MSRPSRLEDVRAYPLQWPEERKRIGPYQRDSSRPRWSGNFSSAMTDLENELRAASIHTWIMSSNLMPHSRATESVVDPAIAVWFNQRVRNQWVLSVLAADGHDKLWVNIKAIAMTLNRMRLIGDYGVYSFDQAIQGAAFLALPGPETPPARPWRTVFTIDGVEPSSMGDIEMAYRFLARRHAADQAKLLELNVARDAAKKDLGVTV